MSPDAITNENYRDVALDLFRDQLESNVAYHAQLLRWGYSDDDTDYITTMLDATKTLLDISYDGSRDDLIEFLFMPRDAYQALIDNNRKAAPIHEPLAYIDSAGGLAPRVNAYIREEE